MSHTPSHVHVCFHVLAAASTRYTDSEREREVDQRDRETESEREREERIERVHETHSDLTVVARASRRSCSNLSCAIARALSS